MTTLPPGLPLILALVGRFFGFAPVVMFKVIAASTALGLIAAYELLRRVEGRGIAAVGCLLLASSPSMFGFNTGVVFPEMPYLLASMVVLLLAVSIDRDRSGKAPIIRVLILSVTLIMALLIRSVGVALVAGLGTWIVASFLFARETGPRRMKVFAIPLILGMAAQMSWSVWAQHHQVMQWKLPGYPESYVSQLKVKNGEYPELGEARIRDIPGRIGRNIAMRSAGYSHLLIRRTPAMFWSSPAIAGTVMLIALGLATSLWGGGQLHDWYFLWYEFIFMVWPWDYRDRFIFPAVPLACLYLWRGAKAIRDFSIRQPKTAGACLALVGMVLCVSSAAFAFGRATFQVNPQHVKGDHLQTIAATVFWACVAIVGFGMCGLRSLRRMSDDVGTYARFRRFTESAGPRILGVVAILVVSFLVLSATKQLVAVGRDNVNPDITKNALYPEFEAASWVRAHEPSGVILMDREPEFVSHFTSSRVVWFPPISDTSVLMDGIRRYQVGAIIVSHHAGSYWLPPEDEIFQALLQAHGSDFTLLHQGPDNWVYGVVPAQVPGE
jgi:hypothetical protein